MQIKTEKSVLIFCDLNDCGGGVYIYTQQITKVFRESNTSVYIISHEPYGAKESSFVPSLMEGTSGYRLIPNNISDCEIVKRILDYAREIRPTWFFPNYREGAHAAMVPLKKLGIGNIFVSHNDHESQYRYAFRYQSVIDVFVCPSKKCEVFLRDHLKKSACSRVKYIPHCVDIVTDHSVHKVLGNGPVKLLYCGRIDFDQKQLHYLPLIIKTLQLNGISAELNIVGAGADRAKLEDLFKSQELQNIYFHGHVDRKNLVQYFDGNDIVILTSLYEGFCLALAEAMGCGLPAVAFECGGVIDDYLINGTNGYIVTFGDAKEFATKIQLLVSNKDIYSRFSLCATKTIREEFSWGLFLENYKVLACASSELKYSWPLIRSIYIPQSKTSFSGVFDCVGKYLFKWA